MYMRRAASAAASHPLYRENERGAKKSFRLHKVARTASPGQPLGNTRVRETLTQTAKHIHPYVEQQSS
jgi:hypothetical protein